jgi:hypothetical protein
MLSERTQFDRLFDTLLSGLVPGVGQVHQRRYGAAIRFALPAVTLLLVMVLFPPASPLAFVGLLMVTFWSMFDAYRAAPVPPA